MRSPPRTNCGRRLSIVLPLIVTKPSPPAVPPPSPGAAILVRSIDKQRGDIALTFDVDRDILAEPAAVLSVAARAFAQALVAEEDRVVALGNLDRCRRDVGWP